MKEKIKGIVDNNLSVLVIYACLVAVIFAGIISKGSTYLSGYDNLTQTYAWLYKQWAAIHNHEIALWDFQPGGGSSFIGELQTAPFYPLNIIFSLVVQNFSLNSVNIYIYIHFVLAAFFMYLCIKEHGRSGASAFIGGVVFFIPGTLPHCVFNARHFQESICTGKYIYGNDMDSFDYCIFETGI